MSTRPKLLYIADGKAGDDALPSDLDRHYDVVRAADLAAGIEHLRAAPQEFEALLLRGRAWRDVLALGGRLRSEQLLEGMADGVVLLDANNTILWCNSRMNEWTGRDSLVGQNFYSVLGSPEILGPDYCPFHSALSTGEATHSTLRTEDNRYYQVHATPAEKGTEPPAQHLIVTVRDVTPEMLQQQKLAAIHQAGLELADLKPEELLHMTVEDRIELLKSNILHYTKDLLHFDFIEIRLLDSKSGELVPLLEVGMVPEAAGRPLYARPQNNGVTGFVAATGKSYLCEDTSEDPLYLRGAQDAKSSLTVPLILHDKGIGTFNVESPEPKAFTESDLQFLELFGREVAAALNTLELLVAEKAGTAHESVEAIHSAVAIPVDDILNDAVNIMEQYIGHESEVTERLQRILRNARDIKQLIQKVGQRMTPAQAHPQVLPVYDRPLLRDRQVLVVDADDSVRQAAHALLDRYNCIVETAHDGSEAIFMVRNMNLHSKYDVIIADIRLPDMTGYELLLKLRELMDPVPLILMTGFGYDPGHSIVKARQAGLKAVLYKPFRLDQLLSAVEQVISETADSLSGKPS